MKNKIIKRILEVCHNSKEGHIPSSLSILDILIVLYEKLIPQNNHFILSKGHASLGLYSVLEHFKLLEESLDNFCKFDSKLGGHPSNKIKNVECSTGSLGQVLNVGDVNLNFSKIDIANNIKKQINFELIDSTLPDLDDRNFQVSFDKINNLGFKTKFSLNDGINDLKTLYSFYRYNLPYNII